MFEQVNNDYLLNIMGFQRIQRVLDALKTPMPISSSALHPFSLATILNDITINNRQNIMEFGGGVSTVVIAKYFQMYDLPGKVYTVEQDEDWIDFLQKKLSKEGLSDRADLIFAPIETTSRSKENWYKANFVKKFTGEKIAIDLMLVDGPQAWRPADTEIRKNVPKAVFDLLAKNSSLYLDDINRKGEAKAMKEWSEKYGFKFHKLLSKTGVAVRGKRHNFSIL